MFLSTPQPMNAAAQILRSNRALAIFLAKMVIAYAVWFVTYDLWLLPDGRLDSALSVTVASATGALMSLFSDVVTVDGRVVWLGSRHGIEIANGCNGLSALSLFVGFVIAYPGSWKRRTLFVPLGLATIVLTNVARCISLLMVQQHRPEYFDLAHYGHAMMVFYVVIFALWVLWAHVGEEPKRTNVALAA